MPRKLRTDDPSIDSTNTADPVQRVRSIALQLPQTTERLSHGEPTFFINDKKTFVMTVNDHHGDGILGMWIAAPKGEQESLIGENPRVYFRPPYVGHRGWVGVRLDTDPVLDQQTLVELIHQAWSEVAPKKLLAAHEEPKS